MSTAIGIILAVAIIAVYVLILALCKIAGESDARMENLRAERMRLERREP